MGRGTGKPPCEGGPSSKRPGPALSTYVLQFTPHDIAKKMFQNIIFETTCDIYQIARIDIRRYSPTTYSRPLRNNGFSRTDLSHSIAHQPPTIGEIMFCRICLLQ